MTTKTYTDEELKKMTISELENLKAQCKDQSLINRINEIIKKKKEKKRKQPDFPDIC